MEELLTAALLGSAPLAALIGAGVHWDQAPQGAAFPCVVLQDVSTVYTHTMRGRDRLTASVVRMSAYSFDDAQVLAIRDALIALGDTLLTPPLALELRISRGDIDPGETPPADGVSSSDLRRQTLEFDVWFTPT